MQAPLIGCTNRLRRTPFSRRVEAAGVSAYTVYNHMLLATCFRSLEEDYAHLKSAVQVWDVACERQVEIRGPDARRLVQLSTPRDLARMADDQCYYIPTVDAGGCMLNDPVLIKLAADRYWVSLADTDMLLYYRGLAAGFGLRVEVFEPDVSPLAIQGPKSNELVRRVFGESVVQTRFFRYRRVSIEGREMLIARSGWSKQGGFEIYVDATAHGEALWDRLFEAGADLDVRAGCPNGIERIEGGLLSFGADITLSHTPFEAGLGRFCNLESASACLGHASLLAAREPRRRVRPLEIDGAALSGPTWFWPVRDARGDNVGEVSSAAWSPEFRTNVAIGTLRADCTAAGTQLSVATPAGERGLQVRENYWIAGDHGPASA